MTGGRGTRRGRREGTGRPSRNTRAHRTGGLALWSVALWLLAWHLAALALGSELLLPAPLTVATHLVADLAQPSSWERIAFSLARVVAGFAGGMAVAAAGAALAARNRRLEELFAPPIALAKSVPVAAITVLALVWLRSSELSVLVVMLVVVPLSYEALLAGIRARDPRLSEMAEVFRLGWRRRIRFVLFPQLAPALSASCTTGLGMAWKACVAAEIIGIPMGSVGEAFYDAKVHFDTADLFAWTVAVVALSVCMERLLALALRALHAAALRGPAAARRHASDAHRGQQAASASGVALRLRNVSRQFSPSSGLGAVSFDVAPGRPVAVMAPSGTGKTTLLRIVAGLEDADGDVEGTEHARISMVFQEDRLIEGASVLANALLAASPRGSSPDEAIRLLGSLGLGSCLDQPVATCSGGQRRRVALARALLAPHEILLLDEPFAGLDDSARDAAAALVSEREGRACMLVATHDRRDAALLGARVVELHRAREGRP